MRAIEFTNRGDGAHQCSPSSNANAAPGCPTSSSGIGSVFDAGTAALYLNLGASFVVSPTLSPEVAAVCNRRKVAYMPGCATPTEVARAEELGCEIVKLFPARLGGPKLVSDILAPCPWSRLMPTGGIAPDRESLTAWFAAGAACVGLGSQLFPADDVAAGRWDVITDRARSTLDLVDRVPASAQGSVGVTSLAAIGTLSIDRREPRWDCVALGEVMLRLDPGAGRIRTARTFDVWEGGGEYNVARALRRCFGLRTAIVTALVDNDVGRLVESLMQAGGVDTRHVCWHRFDGLGRTARVGLNFTERGFGLRPARTIYDRGHTAAAAMRPGEVDWARIFGDEGVRWLHTGGIFAALSPSAGDVLLEALLAAKETGTVVSYDLNYRAGLWAGQGGRDRAVEVNRALAPYVDVMLGNEEDFSAALGFAVDGVDADLSELDPTNFEAMIDQVVGAFPERPGRRHDAAAGDYGEPQRLERRRLQRRRVPPRDGAARPRDLRSGRRWRRVRVGVDLRPALGQTVRNGGGVRCRSRSAGDDDARGHVDGLARRGRGGDAGAHRASAVR